QDSCLTILVSVVLVNARVRVARSPPRSADRLSQSRQRTAVADCPCCDRQAQEFQTTRSSFMCHGPRCHSWLLTDTSSVLQAFRHRPSVHCPLTPRPSPAESHHRNHSRRLNVPTGSPVPRPAPARGPLGAALMSRLCVWSLALVAVLLVLVGS